MIDTKAFKKVRKAILMGVLPTLAISCGSYQQASYYDNDGIYTDDAPRMVEQRPERRDYNRNTQTQEENTYADYFGQKRINTKISSPMRFLPMLTATVATIWTKTSPKTN